MRYRRARTKGGTYFFTVVTFKRERILTKPENVTLLREAFRHVMGNHHFTIDAFVLLPDHLHCIWSLPDGDCDFSTRWRLIKSYFSRKCDKGYKATPYESRKKKEQAIWQRRFWEHLIRDDDDIIKRMEYIHYYRVKHGFVSAPKDWTYSSFHRYVQEGKYSPEWAAGIEMKLPESVENE